MKILTQICLWLLIIGGLNWGLVGFLGFDLIAAIFGVMTIVSRIIYALVGLAAIWVIIDFFSNIRLKDLND